MGANGSPLGYIKYKTPLNRCKVCKLEYRGTICPKCGTPANPEHQPTPKVKTNHNKKTPEFYISYFSTLIVSSAIIFAFSINGSKLSITEHVVICIASVSLITAIISFVIFAISALLKKRKQSALNYGVLSCIIFVPSFIVFAILSNIH